LVKIIIDYNHLTLKINQPAPAFRLPDQDGKIHQLKDYLGKWVLIYFYPKDNTPGCTKEACVMRDNLPDFKKLKAVVLGVSADSADSHQRFMAKHRLNFTLLSDPDKKVITSYGAWGQKKFMGKNFLGIKRSSVLINPQGKIAKLYPNVKPPLHAQEVITDLEQLQK
jgi:peroxiredoxin Q/BCP